MASTQVARAESGKVQTCEFELEVALPVSVLWDAVKNVNKFIVKIAPQMIASIEEKAEGKLESGKPGVTRIVKYGSIAPEGAYVKDKIVQLDEKARFFKTEELEGGHLAQGFTKFLQSIAVKPKSGSDSKSTAAFVIEYEVDQSKLKEADVVGHIEKTKEMLTALLRLTEEHLQKSSASVSA